MMNIQHFGLTLSHREQAMAKLLPAARYEHREENKMNIETPRITI